MKDKPTDAMIEAGVRALEACRFHETGDEKKAAEIYRAMEAVKPCCEGGPQWGHAWNCPVGHGPLEAARPLADGDMVERSLRREWAERIASQYEVDAVDAIEEGIVRGAMLATPPPKSGLAARLESVYSRLTPGAIETADLDGMAFAVREAIDALQHKEEAERERDELRALISEANIERLAEDIAIACVDCRTEIREARHRAMVRLGERLRKPLSRDLKRLKP